MTTGENIPTTREAPGKVEGSLAAESAHKGGEFASNPGMEQAPQKRSQPQASASAAAPSKTTSLHVENQQTARGTGQGKTAKETTSSSGGGGGGGLESQESYGGAAPTYVTNQRYRDPAGPHGKNLQEGGFEGSGTEAGPLPEPGSKDDPTRTAMRDLQTGLRSAPGQGAGPRQPGAVEGKHWYSPLDGDEPA